MDNPGGPVDSRPAPPPVSGGAPAPPVVAAAPPPGAPGPRGRAGPRAPRPAGGVGGGGARGGGTGGRAGRGGRSQRGAPGGAAAAASRRSASQHQPEGAGVIIDMEPVADVLAVAVDRHGSPASALDRERNQFFGELIWPVVVGAIGDQQRQPVGTLPGAREMIGTGLARRIRRARVVRRAFGEVSRLPKGTEHLIGRDVEKAEGRRGRPGLREQVAERAASQMSARTKRCRGSSSAPASDSRLPA